MSEMEYRVGQLTPINKSHVIGIYGARNDLSLDEYIEKLKDDETLVEIDGNLYSNVGVSMDENYESSAHEATDGTINYALAYYNGGTYFEEDLEEAIKNMRKKL